MEILYTGNPPQRGYQDDAGLDLLCSTPTTIPPHQTAEIPTGTAIKAPPGHWVLLTGRSSAARRGLIAIQGVIDPGYTGPLFAIVHNITDQPINIGYGERVAQLILMTNHTPEANLTQVEQLPTTPRGSNGFGSTGQ